MPPPADAYVMGADIVFGEWTALCPCARANSLALYADMRQAVAEVEAPQLRRWRRKAMHASLTVLRFYPRALPQ